MQYNKLNNSYQNLIYILLIFLNTTLLFSYDEAIRSKVVAKIENNNLIYYIDIKNISKETIFMNIGGWIFQDRSKPIDFMFSAYLYSDSPNNMIEIYEIKRNKINKKHLTYESKDTFNRPYKYMHHIPYSFDTVYSPKIIKINKYEKKEIILKIINFKSIGLITSNNFETSIILSYAKHHSLNINQISCLNKTVILNKSNNNFNLTIDNYESLSKNNKFQRVHYFYQFLNENVKMTDQIKNILKTKFYWKKTMKCIIEVPNK